MTVLISVYDFGTLDPPGVSFLSWKKLATTSISEKISMQAYYSSELR
jgi:hypothetical protein